MPLGPVEDFTQALPFSSELRVDGEALPGHVRWRGWAEVRFEETGRSLSDTDCHVGELATLFWNLHWSHSAIRFSGAGQDEEAGLRRFPRCQSPAPPTPSRRVVSLLRRPRNRDSAVVGLLGLKRWMVSFCCSSCICDCWLLCPAL